MKISIRSFLKKSMLTSGEILHHTKERKEHGDCAFVDAGNISDIELSIINLLVDNVTHASIVLRDLYGELLTKRIDYEAFT